MAKKQDIYEILGNKFGRLTPLEEVSPYVCNSGNRRRFKCKCDCGNEKIVKLYSLKSGETQSCGCYNKEIVKKSKFTHGLINTSEYRSWYNMKTRCYNKMSTNYSKWGGRGIKVCDRWLNSFENFLADMGNKPTPKHSIDRIDVHGDYEPNNCRWATKKEQMNNMTTNRIIIYNNEQKTMMQWSEIFNINYDYLKYKLRKGHTLEEILNLS